MHFYVAFLPTILHEKTVRPFRCGFVQHVKAEANAAEKNGADDFQNQSL